MRLAPRLLAAAGAAAAGLAAAQCRARTAADDIAGAPYALSGASCPAHDPAVASALGVDGVQQLYVWATDAGARAPLLRQWCSADRASFQVCGHILPAGLPSWAAALVPTATNAWAPDVSYFAGTGQWHAYYAVSEFGKRVSCIGLAQTPTLDPRDAAFGWRDAGRPVLCTNESDAYNAIDANVVWDAASGSPSLVFGSFWSGIQVLPLDAATGLLAAGAQQPVNIASRDQPGSDGAIEGAFMVHSNHSAMPGYFLFVSWDHCCQGAKR